MEGMLSERQKTILDTVIREYVATAEPVASAELARKYRLGFSPATVRSELVALDEAGYLDQPHTSAGRIPTDRGYRFFINHMMGSAPLRQSREAGGIADREERVLRRLALLDEPGEFVRQAGRALAHLTRSFVLASLPDEDLFYKAGLAEVMQEPEFSDGLAVHEFSSLLDTIEDDFRRWFDPADLNEPRTFIGRENPIPRARHYGMIVAACPTPFEKAGIIALIGPKRMDYEHNLALLRHFREILDAAYE